VTGRIGDELRDSERLGVLLQALGAEQLSNDRRIGRAERIGRSADGPSGAERLVPVLRPRGLQRPSVPDRLDLSSNMSESYRHGR
jgi:hypothetical protein